MCEFFGDDGEIFCLVEIVCEVVVFDVEVDLSVFLCFCQFDEIMQQSLVDFLSLLERMYVEDQFWDCDVDEVEFWCILWKYVILCGVDGNIVGIGCDEVFVGGVFLFGQVFLMVWGYQYFVLWMYFFGVLVCCFDEYVIEEYGICLCGFLEGEFVVYDVSIGLRCYVVMLGSCECWCCFFVFMF